MKKILLLILIVAALPCGAADIMNMRQRAELLDRILEQRLTQVLPGLMRRSGIDMWIIMSREYNEDPVLMTMLPADWMSARRHTMLVIHDPGEDQPLERLAVARYPVGDGFEQAWDREQQPDQWQALAALIAARNPASIAIDTSEHFALADGMSSTEKRQLLEVLPESLQQRVVSAEPLAIAWLETRSELEMQYYPDLVALGHELIATAFSNQVITPGLTTTEDVAWWLRDRTTQLGLSNWFHPSVSLQRADKTEFDQIDTFTNGESDKIIRPGDLLHVDFGLTYLRLNTDQQQHAYVLKPGETAAPEALIGALAAANRLQDILISNFKAGSSGNEILAQSLKQAREEGLKPAIYTHPLGFHGHAAGPTIGMWDAQDGVAHTGDYRMHPDTAYSIELNAASDIPEWGKEIRIMLRKTPSLTVKASPIWPAGRRRST